MARKHAFASIPSALLYSGTRLSTQGYLHTGPPVVYSDVIQYDLCVWFTYMPYRRGVQEMGPSTKRGRKGHEKSSKGPYSGHEVDAMSGGVGYHLSRL